ncbi:MAG: gliding motility-associated C-terminal domain-containing protein [Saprospiraceae bacterium]|nr:gliding motility-associated C-terminal domain-containing protein [Saprospiraceae bacterium]
MRKILISFVAAFLFLIQSNQAQVTVLFSNVEVDPGQTASVDVTVNGFTNVLGAQFSINFDSLILGYTSVSNFTTALPGLNSSAVSGPNGVGVLNGQITFSWFDTQGTGKSLPNGTRLFTINFSTPGPVCSFSDIVLSDEPRDIEFINSNTLSEYTVSGVTGRVQLRCDGPVDPCPDPSCSNPSNLTFTGAKLNVLPGSQVCVPITVRNFNDMQSGQGSLTWNPSLLSFIEVRNFGIPGLDGGLNLTNTASGQLGFIWSNSTPDTPLDLPDNTVMFELCFTALGSVGQVACVLIGSTGTIPTEWTTDDGELPLCFSHGKVTISATPPQSPVIIKASQVEGNKGSTVCVDIRVDSFTNIQGMNFTLTWDANVVDYVNTGMYDLEGLTSGGITNNGNTLRFLWLSPNGEPITKPNNHKIFQACFLLKGDCDATTSVNFINPIDAIRMTIEIPVQTVPGSITIKCVVPPDTASCDIVTQVNPSCNGGTNGSITLNIVDAPNTNCDCIWKKDGVIIKNNKVTADCNLSNVGAGTYVYELTCNGVVECTQTVTLTQPAAISVTGVVSNAACGLRGSITVNAAGGTPPYSYNWNPNLGNTSNPIDLDAGVYLVTVTDSRQCTGTQSFTIGSTVQDLVVSATSTNVKCKDGTDGTITLSVTGGCPQYTFNWSGPGAPTGQNPQNLRAGTYTVTVSDAGGDSATASVTITEPATSVSVALNGTTKDTPPGSNTGSISITVSGGTPGYTVRWSGSPTTIPDGNTTGPLTAGSLGAGTYSVTATDANGCTAVRNAIVVEEGTVDPTPLAPKIGSVSVATNFNGFSVPCNGNCNAVISATLTEGDTPITAVLRRGNENTQTLTLNSLAEVRFTGICAGTYVVVFTNAVGSVTSMPVSVTQPSRLAATTKVDCTEGDNDNGRIEINLNNSGVSPYNFNWIGLPDTGSVLDDLGLGTYSVSITDANDCVLLISNLDVKNCVDTENCYKAIPVITPDGDFKNDLFVINCAGQSPGDLTVFDRYGRIVYTQANYDNTWAGVDRSNNPLPEGAYMWVFDVNFGQGIREIYKGTVTVLVRK